MNINIKKSVVLIAVIIIICILVNHYNIKTKNVTSTMTDFFFDTSITISIYAGNCSDSFEDIIKSCFEKCKYYEELFSTNIKTSETSIFNNEKSSLKVSNETKELIELSIFYGSITNGAFDITTYPVSKLWNFKENAATLPSDNEIMNSLNYVDYNNISLNENIISKTSPEVEIDFGGIAKGYIADKLKEHLLDKGVTSAIINLGGNIMTVGCNTSGDNFKIGIKKPFSVNDYSAIVHINSLSVVTSGVYERSFNIGEKIYHHILDPKTGYPCNNNLYSVTIISKSSATADALSTGCFVLGLEKGLEIIEELDDVEAVFIDDKYQLHLSSGLKIDKNNNITVN